MKYLTKALALAALCFSSASLAEFQLDGPIQLTLADGNQQQTEFGFAFLQNDGGYQFKLGQHNMAVEEVPKRYTLALMLNKDQLVWARDFSKAPLSGFHWQIGKHQLKLFKQKLQPARPGDFVLLIDDLRYHFIEGRPAQIHFHFDEKGITEIAVEAMLQPKR
ncbi:hypothetical protein [Rheinheimera texasensis]|uniref:hypothetical protein n=1 Tax=Rheinheimera texasensis TaxID=306205 RepID=UPI000689EE41|nr:hypothetical protein [Rheinheimera texasensis]